MNDFDSFSRMLKQLPVDDKGYYDPLAPTHEELKAENASLSAALEAAERARNECISGVMALEVVAKIAAERDALKERAEKAEAERDEVLAVMGHTRALLDREALIEQAAALKEQVEAAREAIRHVVDDSPGTPDSVKDYLAAVWARLDQLPKTLCEMTHPGEPCPADQREGQR